MNKRNCWVLAAALGLHAGSVWGGSLDEGLVSYHRFEGNLQDTQANMHPGVASVAEMPSFGPGFAGQSARFDGTSDAVRFPSIANSEFSGDFSIAWFMKIDTHRKYSLLGKRDSCSVSNHFDVRASPDTPSQVRFELSKPSANPSAAGSDLPLGQWVHIAVVRTASEAVVYTDGVAGTPVALPVLNFASISAALGVSTSPCIAFGDGTRRFEGQLDELRVYRRALSASDAAALAQGGGIQSDGEVTITPTTTGAGGQVVVTAPTAFASGGAYTCRARLGLGGPLLGPVAIDPDTGDVFGEVTLPSDTPAGEYLLQLECAAITAEYMPVGHDTLTVVGAASVVLDRGDGFAGQPIAFDVQNAVGRTLELWFDGQRVHGPVVLVDGQASGVFTPKLPASGTPLPITGMLEARAYTGRLLTSSVGIAFTQQDDPGFRVRLDSVSLPMQAPPQTALTISGRIVVASGSPQSRTINLFFRGADGRVVPLGSRDIVADAQGQFTLQIEMPSMATLDGYVAQGLGQVFFTFTEIDPLTQTVRTYTELAGPLDAIGYASPEASARIEVLVTGDNGGSLGTPLEGAYVVIGGGVGSDFFDDPDADAGLAAAGPLNQISRVLGEVSAYRACPVNLAAGYTDANGMFSAQLDANQVREWLLRRGMLQQAVCSTDINAPHCVSVERVEASVEVFTAQLGYGVVQGGVAVNYEYPAQFVPSQVGNGGQFFDPRNGQPWNSTTDAWRITVVAPPITPALTVRPFRRRTVNDGPSMGIAGDDYLPLNKLIVAGVPRYQPRPAVQFDVPAALPSCMVDPDADPCVTGMPAEGLELSYFHDVNVGGVLQSGYPRLVMCADGGFDCAAQSGNTFEMAIDAQQPSGPEACESGLSRYALSMPTDVRTPNDAQLRGRIEVRSTFDPPGPGSTVPLQGRANVQLTLDPLPSWFYVPPGQGQPTLRLTERKLTRNPNGSLTFEGHEDLADDGRGAPGRDLDSNSNQFGAVNLDSPQRNATRSGRTIYRTQMNRSEALFEQDADLSTDNDVANNAARGISPSINALANPMTEPLQTEEIIDTGSLPLFRFAYGVPPIAAATLGADFWLQAGVSYGGAFEPASEVPNLVYITEPYSRFGVDLFFDLSAVGGLVSATAEASARAYLANRALYTNGSFDADSYQCFGFNIDVTLEICALFCTSIGDTLVGVYEARPSNSFNDLNCQASTLALPGFPMSAPPPAAEAFKTTPSVRPTLRARADASMGYDAQGRGAVMYVDDAGRLMRDRLPLCRSTGCSTVVESAGASVTSTATAAIGAGSGITLWSKVSGNPTSIDDATSMQHIRWARYAADGSVHPPQDLTPPGSADGSVVVGVCPSGRGSCPSGGEVTAAWLRRLGSSWDAHHYALMYARYRPATGWTTPERLDPAQGQASDLQPSVAYRTGTGTPIVAWVRKPSPGLQDLSARRVAYRFLDGSSPVRLPADLPAAVSWPSITTRVVREGGFDVEQLVLAYTVNVDAEANASRQQAFLGNTNALQVARCTFGSGDSCAFTSEQLHDRFGRTLRVEKPNVVADASGNLAVSFNGLGFGPDADGNTRRITDPQGTLSGQGDLLVVRPRLDGSAVSVLDLDPGSIGGFKNAVAFNPVLDTFDAIAQSIDIGPGAVTKMARTLGLRPLVKGSATNVGGMRLANLAAGPDLRVDALRSTQRRLQPGATVDVDVVVRNLGRAYVPAQPQDLQLVATWDGPDGTAPAAWIEALPAIDLDGLVERSIAVPVPVTFGASEAHTLIVSVQVAADAGETDSSDNARAIVFGSLPGAVDLKVAYEPGEPMVYLSWDAADADDPRIAGWRVMTLEADGRRVPLGSTPVRGFVDLSARFDETRRYVVVAYADNGLESSESDWIDAAPVRLGLIGDALFDDGFESLPP